MIANLYRPRASGKGERGSLKTPEPWVWCGLALLSTFLPFALNWGVIGVADFDQFATFAQIALWWHQLGDYSVTWNPFMCGGATLVGNPQIPLFHPNILLYWLFGPVNGLGLSFLPWMAAGFWGMWKLAESYDLQRAPAAWIATAWAVNGFFIGQLGSMHVLFSAFYLLPALFLVNRSIALRCDMRAVAALPFLIALATFFNHDFIAYSSPFVLAHFLLEAWTQRREPLLTRKLVLYGLGVVLAVGMLGMFLLPNLAWSYEFPRFEAGEFENPLSFLQMLISPIAALKFTHRHSQFERYYVIGPVLFIIFVIGLWRRVFLRRNLMPLVIVAVLAFATAIGSLHPLHLPTVTPFDLVRKFIPAYQAIRVPSRFFINAIPAILLVTGLAWQQMIDKGRWSRRVRIWVAVGALAPLLLFNFGYLQFSLFSVQRGVYRPQPAQPAGDFKWAAPGHKFRMMSVLEPNVGILDCYHALDIPQAKDLKAEHGFVLSADPGVTVERINWGEIVVHTSVPTTVRFNFNHHRDWRVTATDGTAKIVSKNDQPLALTISRGTFARLRYEVPEWALGIKVSLAATALALLYAAACVVGWRRAMPREEGSAA